jgi:biopolymer transport protein ExbD
MRSFHDSEDRPPEINVVALIDVIFAILTFFIVSSLSLSRTEGVPVNLPGASSGQSQDQTKIVVSVDSQGVLSVNRQPATMASLSAQIKALVVKGQPNMVVINADEKSDHGIIVGVMDVVKQIPDVKMGIATKSR